MSLKRWQRIADDNPQLPMRIEKYYIRRVQQLGCRESRDKLLLTNICKILKQVNSFKCPNHIDRSDLITEAIIAFYETIEKFDLKNYDKPIYAFVYKRVHWRLRSFLKEQNVVKLNTNQYTQIRRYKQIVREYIDKYDRHPDDTYVAKQLGITTNTVPIIRHRMEISHCESLEKDLTNDESDNLRLMDTISDEGANNTYRQIDARMDIKYFLQFLKPKQQTILILTCGLFNLGAYDLEAVSKFVGVTRQYASSYKTAATKKLQKIAELEKDGALNIVSTYKTYDLVDVDEIMKKILDLGLESKEEKSERLANNKKPA